MMMKIKIVNRLTEPKEITEKYISALYGCSLVEFARQIEREKAAVNTTSILTDKKAAGL